MIHKLLVGSRGIGSEMLKRLEDFNVKIYNYSFPPFPNDFRPPLDYDVGGPKGIHICSRDKFEVLPAVLVFEVMLCASGGCKFRPSHSFSPYWLPIVTIPHEEFHPNWDVVRPFNAAEAVCGLAQYPFLNRIRFYSRRCDGMWGEAQISKGNIFVGSGSTSWGHHRAFVDRRCVSPIREFVST